MKPKRKPPKPIKAPTFTLGKAPHRPMANKPALASAPRPQRSVAGPASPRVKGPLS